MKKLFLLLLLFAAVANLGAQTVIGVSSYDVQTNNGAKHRVKVYDDGSVSGLWTGSTDFSGATLFTDRGMFYNHKDAGMPWDPYPTTRVETLKTGFGEIIQVGSHEVVMAHDGASASIQLFANTTIGGTSWTELAGSDDILGFWPMAYCPSGTDDIYMVNANANPPTELRFSRSDDGGATWAVANYTLPFLTAAEGIPALNTGFNAAETYQVVAHGSDVYVLFGMISSDLVLLHSSDYGNIGTWDHTVIHDFPIDNYTGTVQTDTNLDGITDTIATTDGYHNMIVTDDGTVHVFAGYYRIYSDALAGFWTVNWNAMGIWHWQTGMPEAQLIDLTLDWDNADGLNNPYAGIGANRSAYRSAGMASMPGAAWDPTSGHIYLTYTMPIEYTDLFGDPLNFSAQSFRDIFGVYSADGGATWSSPINLTNTASSSKENVYTSVNDHVAGGKIHAVWQRDMYPGTAITDLDPVDTNYIMYNEWTPADFGDVPPTCDATAGPGGLYADGITSDAAVMHWDDVPFASQYIVAFFQAADLGTVGKRRPTDNMYAIPAGKLLPETTYGFRVKTVCYETGEISPYSDIYYFTTLPLREGTLNTQVKIYPNPAHGNFNVVMNGMENTDATMVIINSQGAVVYQNNLHIADADHTESVSTDHLAAGLYNVIINNGAQTISTPVIIQ